MIPFTWANQIHKASLVAQTVKRLPTMWETRVWSLGREDPLEKEMATHSSTLAWKIPWTEEPGMLQSMGSQRVGHEWTTSLSFFLHQIPGDQRWFHNSVFCFYWSIVAIQHYFSFCCTKVNQFCMHMCLVAQSCLTLCHPMDCSLPGSSVREISQTSILEWVAISSARGSSRPRDRTQVSYNSCIADRFFTTEPPGKPNEPTVCIKQGFSKHKHT